MDQDSGTTNGTQSQKHSTFSESSQQDHQTTKSLNTSCLTVAATGLGKTMIMAGLAQRWPDGRVMMLSHRFELNQQAIKEFELVCGEPVDLEQAHFFADQRSVPHRIVVASVQTLNARRKGHYRMERFRAEDFGLLMIDEAHHSAANSYRRVVEYFRSGNPNVKVIGVTATPQRLDGIGLGCVFETVGCNLDLLWGIENGWLVAPKQKFIQVEGLDLSQVRTVGGDLDEKQLAKLVETEKSLHQMAAPIVDICGEHDQSIVFTASVAQAHRLGEMIRDYRIRKFGTAENAVVSMDGSWGPQDPRRVDVVAKFKAGEIQYLVNCGIATEGFNCPTVKVVAIGRPTKSASLYLQMMGRGGRPLPFVVDGLESADKRIAAIASSAKPHCTIIDFVGQAGRHKLVSSVDVLAGEQPEAVIERARTIQAKGNFSGSTLQAIHEAQLQLERENEARRAKVTVGVNYKVVEISGNYDLAQIPTVSCPGYLLKTKATEGQRKFMLRLGYTTSQIDSMNTRQASAAIDHAIKNPMNGFARWVNGQKQKEEREKEARGGEPNERRSNGF